MWGCGVTYPHHYHRETIFTGAGWPYRCRCGEGDAIGGVRGDNCPAAMREEIARLTGIADKARIDGYRAAILTNGSTPYPLLDVLRILADATDHLFREHDCDSQGWEVRKEAASAAREIIAEVVRVCGEDIVNDGHGDGGSDFACNFRHKEQA